MPSSAGTDETQATTSFDLVIPPDPELLRMVRLVASGLASLTKLDLDGVEALRVAADELVAALIHATDAGPITITFELRPGSVTIHGHAPIADEAAFALEPLTERILDAVTTSYEWHASAGELHGRIHQAV